MTREEAKEILLRPFNMKNAPQDILEAHKMAIKALEQEPKIGHWIMHDYHRECSICKVWLPKHMMRNSYCPNCGCRMESKVEEEENETNDN